MNNMHYLCMYLNHKLTEEMPITPYVNANILDL